MPAKSSFKSPLPLLGPASIAIVGASERAKWPGQIYRNLRDYGFPGKIYPVNPRGGEVWGIKCYPDLASLPEAPAHAFVIIPAPGVQGVLETGVAAGLKSATVYASQIGEGDDPEIVARGAALKALIDRSGLLICGPNCMGINALREKNFGYPNAELCEQKPGSVAFVTQSGGTVQYIASMGAHRGVYFNYLISSGNEMSLDLADYVNYFVEDPQTRVIALFIEGIRRPAAFMAAAGKALAAGKPIIVIKTGKSQKARDSAQSHTGAIAGDYGAFTAMCERYGIVVCRTLDEMIETLLVFQAGRLPKGPRVGWVTTSGGTVDLLFDYLEEFERRRDARIQRRHQGEAATAGIAGAGVEEPARCRQSDQRCFRRGALQRGSQRPQHRHAGLGRYAAERQAGARRHPHQDHRPEHRQAGGRLHPNGLCNRTGIRCTSRRRLASRSCKACLRSSIRSGRWPSTPHARATRSASLHRRKAARKRFKARPSRPRSPGTD